MQDYKKRNQEEDAEVAAREAAGKPTISKMSEDDKEDDKDDVPPGKAFWDGPGTVAEARKRPNPYGVP